MIITHASAAKIEKIEDNFGPLRGCLCFAEVGNTYNLAGECNYQYSIEIDEDKILRVERIFFDHLASDIADFMQDLADELGLDVDADADTIEGLLDDSVSVYELENLSVDAADAGWITQQYQGLIASHLGYGCAQAKDEQGTVYIVDCRNKAWN